MAALLLKGRASFPLLSYYPGPVRGMVGQLSCERQAESPDQ